MKSFLTRLLRVISLSLRGESIDFTKGSINTSIILLAIPMILEMAMESLFAVVDIYFVGRIGVDAIATVGLTESMLTLVYSLAFGASMAVTAMVARRIGEKNPDGAAEVSVQSLWLAFSISLLICVIGLVFAGELLRLMGAGDAMVEKNSGYTRWMLGGNFVIMFIFINNAIFRGAGDAFLAMRALWISNGLNIILDPMLIFGMGPFPEMGIEGAAIATNIGRGVGVLYQFYHLYKGKGAIKFHHISWNINTTLIGRLIKVAAGGTGQFIIASASWVFLMRLMAHFGEDTLAGYTLGIRVLVFTILPAWGLSNAAATLVGQNLGAGNPDRAEQCVWRTGWMNMAFMGTVALVYYFFPYEVLAVFKAEGVVLESGVLTLRVLSLGYIFFAWGMVLAQAFNGAGDTATPTWMNFITFWVLQIPAAYCLVYLMDVGPLGVLSCVAAAEFVLVIISFVVFRKGKWKVVEV